MYSIARILAHPDFRFWLCVDGRGLAGDFTTAMQVGRVQLCVRPGMVRYSPP